jgi:hypothetical protein
MGVMTRRCLSAWNLWIDDPRLFKGMLISGTAIMRIPKAFSNGYPDSCIGGSRVFLEICLRMLVSVVFFALICFAMVFDMGWTWGNGNGNDMELDGLGWSFGVFNKDYIDNPKANQMNAG